MEQTLSVYTGPHRSCFGCGREFYPGEVVRVCNTPALIFCDTDEMDRTCLIKYTLRVGFTDPMITQRQLYVLRLKPEIVVAKR